jgi:hypothetical protein
MSITRPAREVIGVAHRRHGRECRADKGAAHFGDELLARVGGRAKAAGEITVEPVKSAAPVDVMPISA